MEEERRCSEVERERRGEGEEGKAISYIPYLLWASG